LLFRGTLPSPRRPFFLFTVACTCPTLILYFHRGYEMIFGHYLPFFMCFPLTYQTNALSLNIQCDFYEYLFKDHYSMYFFCKSNGFVICYPIHLYAHGYHFQNSWMINFVKYDLNIWGTEVKIHMPLFRQNLGNQKFIHMMWTLTTFTFWYGLSKRTYPFIGL
jgi:hypothetical protein